MSNDMRIVKFQMLINDVNDALNINNIDEAFSLTPWLFKNTKDTYFNKEENINKSLLLIYDYEDLNDYAKVIIEQSNLNLKDWDCKYSTIDKLKNKNLKIEAAKELIKHCKLEENRKKVYYFIFWAMMILTVDKTDQEEKLSLICDFSRMLKISDEEMMDILKIIKIIYQKEDVLFEREDKKISFQSYTVPQYFSKISTLYNLSFVIND